MGLPAKAAQYCSKYMARKGIKEFYNMKYNASDPNFYSSLGIQGKPDKEYICISKLFDAAVAMNLQLFGSVALVQPQCCEEVVTFTDAHRAVAVHRPHFPLGRSPYE